MNDEAPSEFHVLTTRSYLEMRQRPDSILRPVPEGAVIVKMKRPTLSFYRYLYGQVGAAHMWTDLLTIDDDALLAQIHSEKTAIYLLSVDGVPAGYGQLDLNAWPSVELAYFGLIPDFIGRGYGRYFLEWMIQEGWDLGLERLWLHTCTLDHPKALPNYKKQGFSVFDTKKIWQDTGRGESHAA